MSAPRILLFNRAPGYITVQNEFSYVSEYQRRVVQPGDRELIDPVVEVIKEGDFVALTPVCVGEQLYSLDLSVQRVEVVQPIPTRTVRLGGEDLEIAEPEVLSVTVESKLVLEDGATMALLAACPAPEGERSNRELVVLIHLDVVVPEGK